MACSPVAAALGRDPQPAFSETELGLGGKEPNVEFRRSFVISRPQHDVWNFLADVEKVATCMPGAMLTGLRGDRWQGRVALKLGPIGSNFEGEARIIRDPARRRGTILGAGRDRLSASRANAEIDYVLTAEQSGATTRVDITFRALLLGPLAQFGRSAIINNVAARLTDMFAHNLERRLMKSPGAIDDATAPIAVGSLLGTVIFAGMKNALTRLLDKFRRR